MTTAFVLGNGISRQEINLSELRSFGKIYGCNALYREFTPDILVATDRPIATVIQNSGYAKINQFYTRRPIDGMGAKRVPECYFGFSSGPIATAISAQNKHLQIYMLGFDMGPTDEKKFNNVYAGTEFYKSKDSQPTFTGNWVKQLSRIINDHPQTQFIRVCGQTTAKITELESLKNLQHLDMHSFLNLINKKKDL